MDLLIHYASWLAAMALLLVCSAFFSASEAALFYLRRPERRLLAAGNPSQRIAAALLADPDRLLTAVLFWNLLVNLAYFAVASRWSASNWSAAGGPPPRERFPWRPCW